MNYNYLCVYDFETSSKFPDVAQILQIGACIVDPRSLEIVDEFDMLVKPEDMNAIEKEALEINKIKREDLEKATETKEAWSIFTNWVDRYNRGRNGADAYNAPIPCGYNIDGYDSIIVERYCQKFGPKDAKRNRQRLFSQVYSYDLLKQMWFWTESNAEVTKITLSSIQEWMGFSKGELEKAHNALADVRACAKILIKMFRVGRYLTMPRPETGRILLQMKGAFAKNDGESDTTG